MRQSARQDWLWYASVSGAAIAIGLLVAGPQWSHTRDARYRGVAVHLNADEAAYLPRVQEVILGHSDAMGTAITGADQPLPSLQPAVLETAYGVVARWFGLTAADTLNVLDFVEPFFLFLVLTWFLRNLGFSRSKALIGAILFSLFELYSLNRPVHQRGSFLLSILALTLLIEGLERHLLLGMLGGALMGLLVGVYFWAWTTVWAFWGLLLLWEIVVLTVAAQAHRSIRLRVALWLKHLWEWIFRKSPKVPLGPVHALLLFGIVGGLVAAPFLESMVDVSSHPAFTDAFFRSGIARTRIPQSWIWSSLFLVMAVGTALLSPTLRQLHTRRYIVVTVAAAFFLLNQHLFHGVLFLFASHYLFLLVLAAVVTFLSTWGRGYRGITALVASVIFLSGIAYDNRTVLSQWRHDESDFEEQHLASALPELDKLPRMTILSDPQTSAFIASYTRHDVLFTAYAQHELHSHDDLAERYCLTQVAISPVRRTPESEPVLIYGDGYDGFPTVEAKASLRVEELSRVLSMCRRVDARIKSTLGKYGVRYILWDQKRQPAWDLRRMNIRLAEVTRGEGWSLWRIL